MRFGGKLPPLGLTWAATLPGDELWGRTSAKLAGGGRLEVNDIGAGDLVVPALLVLIERDPDEAEPEHGAGEQEPEVAQDRIRRGERAAIGADHPQAQNLVANGLA